MTERNASAGVRLLVVDDSRLIVRMVEEYFADRGFDVEVATSGREALEKLDRQAPDVIVSDVLMPEMDGWELFRAVREREVAADIPFLFLTIEYDLQSRLRGLRAGADDYLTKPFEIEELHARIERSLRRRLHRVRSRRLESAQLGGSVEQLGLPDLLQMLAINGKTGRVEVETGGERGAVHFRNGKILHAEAGSVRGNKALYRMMTWGRARFLFWPDPDVPDTVSVEGNTSNVLMDALLSLDDWNRWHPQLPASPTVLEMTSNARNLLDPSQVDGPMFDVLARARQGADVGAILEDSSYLDGALAKAICTLIAKGVLRPRQTPA